MLLRVRLRPERLVERTLCVDRVVSTTETIDDKWLCDDREQSATKSTTKRRIVLANDPKFAKKPQKL